MSESINELSLSVTDDCDNKSGETAPVSRRRFMQASGSALLAAGAIGQMGAARIEAGAPDSPGNNNLKSDSPTTEEMEARYRRAQALEQGSNTKKVAFNTKIEPNWIKGTDSFWYKRETRTGHQYRIVEAENRKNRVAFGHEALARALSQAAGEEVDVNNLPLGDLELDLSAHTATFTAFEKRWVYEAKQKRCRKIEPWMAVWKVSPDGTKAIFRRDYNLWLYDLNTGREQPLTTDGEKLYFYADTNTVYGWGTQWRGRTLEAIWSPDSKKIFTHVTDTRQVKRGPPLIEYVPADGSLRPRIEKTRPYISEDRRVAFPEDEHIECWQFLAIDVATGHIQKADYTPSPVTYPHYAGYFSSNRGWWSHDSRRVWFIHLDRGGKKAYLLEFDTDTGDTRAVIEETSDTMVRLIPSHSHTNTLIKYLPGTNELVWYSRRSGWAHLYLYDLNNGRLKKQITQGNWMVRDVVHLDAARRELVIQTAGRVKGRNPYYRDICRVNIDTGQLTPLISTDHEYVVGDETGSFRAPGAGVSPSNRYLVTTRSRVDMAPVSLLLDRDGKELMILETADVSGLPAGWKWPEPVMLKAADGKTDIYGVVYRPTHFDPDKSYPVIDCTFYFASPIGGIGNTLDGHWTYLSAAAYAELGFIAVIILGRGNDNLRDETFNNYQDPKFPQNHMFVTYHKDDCVAGIQQLAQRYPYIDINRVGVTGFNTLATALCGLLIYPDFYKVGVTRNPLANWRMIGALGMDENEDYPELEDYAGNLKGKLLLVHGMLDAMVPVGTTLRMVDALRRANKSFDMLLLPNETHMLSSYVVRRTWDYLVEHLLGVEPPKDFDLYIDWMEYYQERYNPSSKKKQGT